MEGLKSVNELTTSQWPMETILCTPDFKGHHGTAYEHAVEVISEEDLYKITNLKNSQGILAIARISTPEIMDSAWKLALDGINDPGNLGTIIRIADWYGISEIICSSDTVDLFNPKVIQATMGSFLRVKLTYCDLTEALKQHKVYATLLQGENIRSIQHPEPGVILIGSEASGISEALLSNIEHLPITIPGSSTTESLNASVATAICCERLVAETN